MVVKIQVCQQGEFVQTIGKTYCAQKMSILPLEDRSGASSPHKVVVNLVVGTTNGEEIAIVPGMEIEVEATLFVETEDPIVEIEQRAIVVKDVILQIVEIKATTSQVFSVN